MFAVKHHTRVVQHATFELPIGGKTSVVQVIDMVAP
jgi:hypothetical protein